MNSDDTLESLLSDEVLHRRSKRATKDSICECKLLKNGKTCYDLDSDGEYIFRHSKEAELRQKNIGK